MRVARPAPRTPVGVGVGHVEQEPVDRRQTHSPIERPDQPVRSDRTGHSAEHRLQRPWPQPLPRPGKRRPVRNVLPHARQRVDHVLRDIVVGVLVKQGQREDEVQGQQRDEDADEGPAPVARHERRALRRRRPAAVRRRLDAPRRDLALARLLARGGRSPSVRAELSLLVLLGRPPRVKTLHRRAGVRFSRRPPVRVVAGASQEKRMAAGHGETTGVGGGSCDLRATGGREVRSGDPPL